jgi:hypothetical protein
MKAKETYTEISSWRSFMGSSRSSSRPEFESSEVYTASLLLAQRILPHSECWARGNPLPAGTSADGADAGELIEMFFDLIAQSDSGSTTLLNLVPTCFGFPYKYAYGPHRNR